MSSASFPRTTRLEKISLRYFASKLYFLLLFMMSASKLIAGLYGDVEQIKKMIVYAIDEAVTDLKALLNFS